ncbi:hypothetical protein GJ496_001547 [Pomphorhynchus laevis]|nr:hypothetical protein GJ496_001547 [Pomphorhynchus laevis]
MSTDPRIQAAVNLARRLPPEKAEDFLDDLLCLAPDLTNELLRSIDRPLVVAYDQIIGREYLLCEYNRDGDSYRSCWSNVYAPHIENGFYPSERLRNLEILANNAFESYKNLYFGGGISSVYFWENDSMVVGGSDSGTNVSSASSLPRAFHGTILLKKALKNLSVEIPAEACWDSIHAVSINERPGSKNNCHYKIISSALLWLTSGEKSSFEHTDSACVTLAGVLMKKSECDSVLEDGFSSHIANIGRLVEDMENRMRSSLEVIYFGKTNDIINRLRSIVNSQHVHEGIRSSNEFKEHLENYLNRRSMHHKL